MKYEPNKDPKQCQCVMSHEDHVENAIPQCKAPKQPGNNLFCWHCEEMHGAYWREMHPEEK